MTPQSDEQALEAMRTRLQASEARLADYRARQAAAPTTRRWLWPARLPKGADMVTWAIDGDTIHLELDKGFRDRAIYPLRLRDVWAPERGQPGYHEAQAFTATWLARYGMNSGWPFTVETFRRKTGTDLTTLERYVAEVSAPLPIFVPPEMPALNLPNLNQAIQAYLDTHPEWGGGTGT